MASTSQEKVFSGKNMERLKRNVEKFKIEIGNSYRGERLASTNPDYVIVVEYYKYDNPNNEQPLK